MKTITVIIATFGFLNIYGQDTTYFDEKHKKSFYVHDMSDKNKFAVKVFYDSTGKNLVENNEPFTYSFYKDSLNYFSNYKLKGNEILEIFNTKLIKPEIDTVYLYTVGQDENLIKYITKLRKHISRNIVYPKEAIRNRIEGRVFVTFIANRQGEIIDYKLTFNKKIGYGLEEEALRVFDLYKKFGVITYQNRPISVYYTVPIYFKP